MNNKDLSKKVLAVFADNVVCISGGDIRAASG